ncbi:PQQ-dependent sugar dehydrogenase [Cryobacterium sp. PH31-AA6]|uniref:PQQ-dependent sugar dehydrogenase n=1 Tax=Cryobacterium sp. PH31-AA6 TaxID=3046205 RepID=UPI0024B9A0FA|nr:PQQ-dependent sugar dehydrogenase [Cryobacterium sp. PH31-AA6]MDJ0325016.1 PQQ-dependent sugar dehydrogenase [Cryobacterium sp. PH31-AA6]
MNGTRGNRGGRRVGETAIGRGGRRDGQTAVSRVGRRVAVLLLAAVLAGCSASAPRASLATETPALPRPTPSASLPPSVLLPVHPVGDPVVIATGLDVPWSILRLPGGTLISERDTALVRELLPDGSLRDAAAIAGVRPGGEGGLLGLAFLASADAAAAGGTGWVYAYFTAAEDNQIVRMPLTGTPGNYGLGAPEPVLSGIPKAGNHDGGRLGFGPDGMLYATAGDAGLPGNAQDLGSLGGKILRMTPTGTVPAGNPFGTLVYSFGHRNPQGIAWDSRGRLWASEFGQNTWDELNLIVPGGNYGWPIVEGTAGNPAFRDPEQQWRTSEASPSGLAIVNDTLFMASLRGARLWRIDPSTGETSDWFVNSFGRLRDVVSGPDGTLWFVSNNTDGRGDPAPGDDKLYQVRVAP